MFAGRVIQPETEEQLNRTLEFLTQSMMGAGRNHKWVRNLDTVNKYYKGSVVGVNPGSQGRIILGNWMQRVINGYDNPMDIVRAIRIMSKHDPMYRDAKGYLQPGHATNESRFKIEFKSPTGRQTLNGNDVYTWFHKNGLGGNFVTPLKEDPLKTSRTKVGGVAHKLYEKNLQFGEGRDNAFRLGTFIGALEKFAAKDGTQTLDQLMAKAAREVRRTHIDFGSLTPFERTIMSRMMPFYAAVSRSTPIVYRQMAAAPGRVAVFPKAIQDFSSSFAPQMGQGTDTWGDLTPQYLTRQGAVPVGYYNGMPVMLNQRGDVFDASNQFSGGPLHALGSNTFGMFGPALKIPMELSLNKVFYTGREIHDKNSSHSKAYDYGQYAISQNPITSLVNRLHKQGQQQSDAQVPDSWHFNPMWLNWIGGGFTNVTPGSQSAQLNDLNESTKRLLRKLRQQQQGQ
jgi:hypothetical protein